MLHQIYYHLLIFPLNIFYKKIERIIPIVFLKSLGYEKATSFTTNCESLTTIVLAQRFLGSGQILTYKLFSKCDEIFMSTKFNHE